MIPAALRPECGYLAHMVTVLKHRLALAVLVGVLVIPLLSVNNAGLSHLLFCETVVAQAFAVGSSDSGGEGAPITSSTQLSRDDPDDPDPGSGSEGQTELTDVARACEGVRAAVSAEPLTDDRVRLTVTIHNDSQLRWRGSVGLAAQGASNSADLTATLGEVAPGSSESASLELRILPGQTEIAGKLLLGP